MWSYPAVLSGENALEILHRRSNIARKRFERLMYPRIVKVLSRSACRVEPAAFGPGRELGFSGASGKTCHAGASDRQERR